MSGPEMFFLGEYPRIGFIDNAQGIHRLDEETLRPYYEEALELASRACFDDIHKYRSTNKLLTRAVSHPVPYLTHDHKEHLIGLAISAGVQERNETPIEQVEMGVFVTNRDETGLEFRPIAIFEKKKLSVRALIVDRDNYPEDLDSFMRGARYIATQITD